MNKDTPLLPLEYCRIDRAARLLGCEAKDILHWGITHRINLNMLLEHEAVMSSPLLDEKTISEMIVALYIDSPEPEAIRARTIEKKEMILDEFTYIDEFQAMDYPPPWFEARANGLWTIASSTLRLYEQENSPGIEDFEIPLSRYTDSDELILISISRDKWVPSINELYIKKEYLHHLNDHIKNGKPLQKLPDGGIASTIATIMPKSKTTAKQSRAIIELLTAHGFTDEDFARSIESLQQKIASKGLSETLTNIDKNTLKAWLERAGVR
jgi:hypothetical protein